MKKIEKYVKSAGVYTATEKINKQAIHLCFDCTNAYVSKCTKIADMPMRRINKYDYILDGYEIIEDGKVVENCISSCENFEKDVIKRRLTPEQIRAASKIKEDLFISLFDALTLDEAREDYEGRIRSGRLVPANGYSVTRR